MDFWGIVLMVAAFGVYFLPMLLAIKKRQYAAIAMLNLFLGWTIIGWIAALIWAVSYERK